MNKIIFIACSVVTLVLHAKEHMEFLYPVAEIDDNFILLLHQKSFDDIELWRWNKNEKIAFKELSSLFLPSLVKLLPSKQACSFIDRGRVKIKYFAKRTPRTIDMYEPISAISSITWINDEEFYFVGKHEGFFSMFLCNIADHNCVVSCLNNLNNQTDYLYPQKINDFLFCITKDSNGQYTISRLAWDPKVYKNELYKTMQTRHLQTISATETTLTSSLNPLCFLQMQDENSGFILEFAPQDLKSNLFSFSCLRLQKQPDDSWSLEKLFDFQLPKNLLIGLESERIYESIYPFLPIYTQDCIFFASFDFGLEACQIFRYNQNSRLIQKINVKNARSPNPSSHLFAPCMLNDTIYVGISSSCTTENSYRSPNLMQANQTTGIFYCELPEIKLSECT